MRIAIVHHHLRPGGVTRVIRSTLAGLAGRDVDCVVLSGEAADTTGNMVLVDGLGYADEPRVPPSILKQRMEEAARARLGARPDVWHIHNHSLGKNSSLTAAVCDLARAGQHLLLHIHDFPEDGRPANYQRLSRQLDKDTPLYPVAPHVHYAVLNSRDHAYLLSAGVPPPQLHLMPNPVQPLSMRDEPASEWPAANRLFLYPTRAIRRKNIGEFLLWAASAPEGDRFASTLAPTNPTDIIPYKRWMDFAKSNRLPVEFELGHHGGTSYPDMVRAASALITTSIAEGFGLAFTEPWLAGRPLVGRRIPDITVDLERNGLDLSALYTRLDVPIEWIGMDFLRSRLTDRLHMLWTAYQRPLPDDAVERSLNAMVADKRVDFGRLDENMQEQVILRVLSDRNAAAQCIPASLNVTRDTRVVIESNRRIVHRNYSLENYVARLINTYGHIQASEIASVHALDEQRLLDHFLAPERFDFLRS